MTVGRNDSCSCGSGKKYKQCCGTLGAPATVSDDPLARAVAHLQAGRLAEAEQACQQVLAATPRHPEAIYVLGVAAERAGNLALATDRLAAAIACAPQPTALRFSELAALQGRQGQHE